MKKCLLASIFFTSIFNAQEKKIIFKEDFSDTKTLEDWGILDRDRDGFSWELGQGSHVTAEAGFDDDTGIIMTVLSYAMDPTRDMGPLDSDDVLYSSVIDIPKEGDIKLSFKIGVQDTKTLIGRDMNNLSYQLFVLEEGQPFYPTLKPLDEKRFSDSVGAETREFSLNDFKGKSVRIYWRHYDAFAQYILMLDDILITSEPEKFNKLTIFPNPVQNILHIRGFKGQVKSYKIYNMAGRLVMEGKEVNEINVNHLSNGNYIIVVEDGDSKLKSLKFIKK